MKNLIIIIVALFLVGCNSEKTENLQKVEKYCKQFIKKNAEFCGCVAAAAKEKLNNNQIAFIAAGFAKDQDKIRALRTKMPMEEVVSVGIFMASSVTQCAKED